MQQRKSTSWRGREGGLDEPRVRRGVANLHHDKGLRRNIVVLHGSVATVHRMEIFMFLFCFILFFHCSEDLSIGLMRTL